MRCSMTFFGWVWKLDGSHPVCGAVADIVSVLVILVFWLLLSSVPELCCAVVTTVLATADAAMRRVSVSLLL